MGGAEYLLAIERINSSLNSINGFICSRPCCFNHQSISSELPQGHHTYIGLANHIWDGKKFTESEIINYENDLKHGVIHGVLCYVIGCITNESIAVNLNKRIEEKNLCEVRRGHKLSNSPLELSKNKYGPEELKISSECYDNPSKEEKFLTTCLVHDFLRCSYGKEDHDKNLKEYFPRIDPVVFSHSSPSPLLEHSLLVQSDRLELFRFKDANEWVDKEKVLSGYSELDLNLIKIFYNMIRPVLEKCFKYKNERWIRHGLERHIAAYEFEKRYPSITIDITKKENFNEVFLGEIPEDKIWSVEISKGSMGDCIVGQDTPKENFEAFWQEANTFFSWELVQGKIPLKEYVRKTNRQLIYSKIRDHFFASGSLPINNWVFTHKNMNSKMIEILMKEEIYFCHEDIVRNFLKTCDKVMDVFYGIKMNYEK
tara:strand:- start:83950 stop:85230 length:1281 start_codon:yes stop_codon:yes gene_type:complete